MGQREKILASWRRRFAELRQEHLHAMVEDQGDPRAAARVVLEMRRLEKAIRAYSSEKLAGPRAGRRRKAAK